MKRQSKTPASEPSTLIEITPRAAKMITGTAIPPKIERLHVKSVPEGLEDSLAALRALLDSQSPGTKYVGLILGRELCSLRMLALPSVESKEIGSMLDLQLGKLTPYPRAEILFAYTKVGSFKEGYTTVLLAIARKTLVDDAMQLLKSRGSSVKWIGVSTEGLEEWWSAFGDKSSEVGTSGQKDVLPDKMTAIIDVDGASTDCAVLSSSGKLLFTYSVSIGSDQLVSSEKAGIRWLGELVRLPRILLHEDVKGRIERAVMTGISEGSGKIVEQLTSQWGVSVQARDALEPMGKSALREQAKVARASFTALSGYLAANRAPRIDLIPPEVRVSQELQVRSRRLARLAITLAAIVVFIAVHFIERIITLQNYLGQLEAQLVVVEQTAERVRSQQATMRSIKNWLDPSQSIVEVLRSIASASSADVTVANLMFKDHDTVRIRGRAVTSSAAYEFSDRLKEQGTFAAVRMRSTAEAKQSTEAGTNFEIVAELSGS